MSFSAEYLVQCHDLRMILYEECKNLKDMDLNCQFSQFLIWLRFLLLLFSHLGIRFLLKCLLQKHSFSNQKRDSLAS